MAKTIKINNTDYTTYFTPKGQNVTYQPVSGINAGYMRSGIYREDEIAIKAKVVLTCMPLTEAQTAAIITDALSSTYVSLYYFDPKANEYKTITARRSISQVIHRGEASSTDYWTGLQFTFTER